MKPSLNLSTSKPCSEKWESFTGVSSGNYCERCCHEVRDFTKMTDRQILAYLKSKQSHTCGRFRQARMKTFPDRSPVRMNAFFSLLKAGMLSLLLVLVSKQTTAQTARIKATSAVVHHDGSAESVILVREDRVVKGMVKDEAGQPMEGVAIYLKDTSIGTATDARGRFEFPIKLKEGEVIVFSFLGYESQEYTVTKATHEGIEIIMRIADVVIMGDLAVTTEYDAGKRTEKNWWSRMKERF